MCFNKEKRKMTSFAMPMVSPKQGKREIEQVLEQNLALWPRLVFPPFLAGVDGLSVDG